MTDKNELDRNDERPEENRDQGFTLIEIMAVVVIMGMLMTVLAVGIGSQLDKARIATARTQIQRIEQEGYLLGCWIASYRPRGTARERRVSPTPSGGGSRATRTRSPTSSATASAAVPRSRTSHRGTPSSTPPARSVASTAT